MTDLKIALMELLRKCQPDQGLSQALWGTKPVRGVSASSARDDPVHQAG